jgi:hypothetical protein
MLWKYDNHISSLVGGDSATDFSSPFRMQDLIASTPRTSSFCMASTNMFFS